MDNVNKEQLSAFVDDELGPEEAEMLVRRLGTSERLRSASIRYAVIGDALRGDLLSGDPRQLPRRVSRALSSEPVPSTTVAAEKRRRFLRPLGSAAVAASVALVAVLSLSDRVAPPADSEAVTVPESATATTLVGGYDSAIISRRAGSPDQLSRYYLNHSQYATMLGGQGPLIRMVRTPAEEDTSDEVEGESRSDDSGER
jgi:negative regulator of sigma E activity